MMKLFSTIVATGLLAVTMTTASQAQESRVLRRMTAGPSPALQNTMTESQARRSCQLEMRGARESKHSLRIKMRQCMDKKMNGR